MTTYVYTGNGSYMEGLPKDDLDTTELTTAQLAILTAALTAGLYEANATTKTLRPTSIDE